MKNILLAISLFISLPFYGQEKGVTPLSPAHSLTGSPAVTRAVVIGISDYQLLPDLQFAARDAEAFAAYLQSPAGGNVPPQNVHLLVNEQATNGNMVKEMGWLMSECQEGDKAVIYFSGHGDVETQTISTLGFLLMYDTPPVSYMAGGYPLMFLNIIISTLSERNKAQVIVISDACRAGKLAGSDIHGAQITAANLAQKIGSEIKILSCQPEEYSIEGMQWGGGRGAFSYHLVEGLTGLADRDQNLEVKLLEIDGYLKEVVPKETDNLQIPNSVGSLNAIIASVDEAALADLKQRKSGQLPQLQPIGTKGIGEEVLAKADTSIQEMYAAFEQAIKLGNLLTPAGTCANDYFEKLIHEESLVTLHGYMRRNFAAALQDESQRVLNLVMLADPQIVDDAFSPVGKYDHIPAYLSRAAALLGTGHYMYPVLKAKQYYFQSKTYRMSNYTGIAWDSLVHLVESSLDSALVFDSLAAYVHFEKAYRQYWLKKGTFALSSIDKALALSPNWVLANYYKGRILGETFGRPGKEFLLKAIALDSFFMPAYRQMAWSEEKTAEEKAKWFSAYILKMQEYEQRYPGKAPVIFYHYLTDAYVHFGRNKEAKVNLLKADSLSHGQSPFINRYLGGVCRRLGQYRQAERYHLRSIELDSFNHNSYLDLRGIYREIHDFRALKNHEERLFQYEKGFWDTDKNICDEINMAYMYWRMGLLQKAEPFYMKYIESKKDTLCNYPLPSFFVDFGWINFLQGKKEAAESSFQEALKSPKDISGDYAPDPRLGLALIALQQGETEHSNQFFKDSWLSWYKNPDRIAEDALFLLGIYNWLDEAILIFTKALEHYPDNASLHYHLGRIYLEQKNDYVKGLPLLERAVQLDGSFVYRFYHLAAAYAHLGKKQAALNYLQKALEKGYDDPEYIEEDTSWKQLKRTKRYQDLMKKYFPNQYKD